MNEIQELHQYAQQALNQKQLAVAQQALIKLLNLDPSFCDGYFLLAIIEAELKQYDKAAGLIEKALTLESKAEYYAHLAKCYALLRKSKACAQAIANTIDCLEQSTSALTLDTLAVALCHIGQHHKAITYFNQAVAKKPSAGCYYNLGSALTFCGQFEQAGDSYERAIELAPLFYQAHSSLTHLGLQGNGHARIDRLKQVYSQLSQADGKLHIAHALAKELEAIGQYQQGFDYLFSAKALKRKQINYHFSRDLALFEAVKTLFSDPDLAAIRQDGIDAQGIFVMAMPRSGTTLIERVLTNKTGVKSLGELPDFALLAKELSQVQSPLLLPKGVIAASRSLNYAELGQRYLDAISPLLEQPNQRFVDKTPLNIWYAAHIIKAMPKAKILCVIRNPMDTIWGNYKQMLSLSDVNYYYAFSRQDIAQYYLQFVALAEFWQKLYPDNFKIVKYDEFVQQPHRVGQLCAQFCQVDWSEQMLAIKDNDSAVATASSVQVRSAIHTQSLQQWKRYQGQLADAVKLIEQAGLGVE